MTKNVEVVQIAGLTGWSTVEVTAAINEAARTFMATTSEAPGEFKLPPGTPVTITANGDLVLTGYVNKFQPRGSKSEHKITLRGRGKGQDVIDCACVHDSHEWWSTAPDQILQDLDKFGVGIKAKVPLSPIDWRTAHGETVFRTGDRMLRDQGVSMMGMPDGSIELTNASVAGRHAGELAEGVNIEDYDGDISDDQQHSEVEVKGQSKHGHGESALRIAEKHANDYVDRYRPRVIVSETDSSKKRARDRAQQEVERAQGASIRCRITTQGWRDDGGVLWEPNRLIFVNSPILLHIVQDMLIERVLFRQSEKEPGTISELHLVDPRTYKGSAGKKKKSDGAWGDRHNTGKQRGARPN